MYARVFLCALLIGVAGAAGAQTSSAPPPQQPAARQLSPEQRAAIEKQNQVLVKYADSIVAMIDNGQVGQVWDEASEVAKQTVSRGGFVKAVDAQRARLGKVTSRKVANITRTISRGEKKLPAGYYVNVNYATQFSKETKPVLEKVSFHLDSDRKWRLSGYTIL